MQCLDKLYPAYWVDNVMTHDKDILTGIFADVLGKEDAERILGMVGKEGKEILALRTDEAFKDGAFGLPWFVCSNADGVSEGFWGVDHLGQVVRHLGLERPGTGAWKAIM